MSNIFKLGNITATAFFVGGTPVVKIFKGTECLYEKVNIILEYASSICFSAAGSSAETLSGTGKNNSGIYFNVGDSTYLTSWCLEFSIGGLESSGVLVSASSGSKGANGLGIYVNGTKLCLSKTTIENDAAKTEVISGSELSYTKGDVIRYAYDDTLKKCFIYNKNSGEYITKDLRDNTYSTLEKGFSSVQSNTTGNTDDDRGTTWMWTTGGKNFITLRSLISISGTNYSEQDFVDTVLKKI